MNITFVGKYPPVTGGESTKLYWLAKNLGERGHECNVVSDCQERKDKTRLSIEDLDYLQPKNVRLYSTSAINNWDAEKGFKTERLADLAIKTIGHRGSDIIIGWYLIPYGSAASLASIYSGKPVVLQHAGSDMKNLFGSTNLKSLLINQFASADGIMSYPSYYHSFSTISDNVFFHNPKVDINGFEESPDFEIPEKLKGKKIITFLGKLSESKGVHDLLNAYEFIGESEEYALMYVGRGKERDTLEKKVKENGLKNVFFSPPVPTWRIPGILRASRAFIIGERDFYVQKHFSKKAMEAMACKTPVIISSEVKNKGVYNNLIDGEHCLEINPRDTKGFAEKLKLLIDNDSLANKLSSNGYKFAYQLNSNYSKYIDEVETFLKNTINDMK